MSSIGIVSRFDAWADKEMATNKFQGYRGGSWFTGYCEALKSAQAKLAEIAREEDNLAYTEHNAAVEQGKQ